MEREVADELTDEIEITPAMIEAGVLELTRFNPDFEGYEEATARIYHAMASVSPRKFNLDENLPIPRQD